MSDVEEPPTKLTKIEDPPTPEMLEGIAPEEDVTDEGQEEWLSEGILTDDDYNHTVENDNNDSNFGNMSQVSQDDKLPINDLIEQLDSSINTDPEDETTTKDKDVKVENAVEEKKVEDPVEKMEVQLEELGDAKVPVAEIASGERTIEETLNNFECVKGDEKTAESASGKITTNDVEEKISEKCKIEKSSEDGNDTDDLLRMLGEDSNKGKKKVIKMKKEVTLKEEHSSDDDDDNGYVYQDVKLLSKYGPLKKGLPTKAEPENMSDGDDENDASSDEEQTVKKMFNIRSKNNVASKSTAKSSAGSLKRPAPKQVVNAPSGKLLHVTPKLTHIQNQKILKPKVAIGINSQTKLDISKSGNSLIQSDSSTRKLDSSTRKPETSIHKFDSSKRKFESNIYKSDTTSNKHESQTHKLQSSRKSESVVRKSESSVHKIESSTRKPESSIHRSNSSVSKSVSSTLKPGNQLSKFDSLKADKNVNDENEEIIDEEEFLEDVDDIGLDEDEFGEDSDMDDQPKVRQKLMKPECMDEEVPSDEDSHSEGGSLYDEMPSSESDDMEDWFRVDIRAERATDYLPFLGSKAREVLLEEKRRVALRLDTLRQSLTALTDSARSQADQIRSASMTLAELDDMLKAT